jgi:WD repeat-containing protein 61
LEGLTRLISVDGGEVKGSWASYQVEESNEEDNGEHNGERVEPSWSVSLHPRGETYASTGGLGNITIHSASSTNFGHTIKTISGPGKQKFGMFCSYSPDGKRIALASENGQITIFDVESGALEASYSTHAMAVRHLAWSHDANLLLSASEDCHLGLHDVRISSPSSKTGSGLVTTFTGHKSWALSSDISADGRLALSGSADKTIKVWDIGARAAVSTIQDTDKVWCVKWRPLGGMTSSTSSFVSAGEAGVVRWWRAAGTGVGSV